MFLHLVSSVKEKKVRQSDRLFSMIGSFLNIVYHKAKKLDLSPYFSEFIHFPGRVVIKWVKINEDELFYLSIIYGLIVKTKKIFFKCGFGLLGLNSYGLNSRWHEKNPPTKCKCLNVPGWNFLFTRQPFFLLSPHVLAHCSGFEKKNRVLKT